MAATLAANGHRPPVRGGNGTGPTSRKRHSLDFGGDGVIIPTGQRVKGGPPSHYKLDLASPAAKIAVEIDGPSHRSLKRREADRRKDQWLNAAGWTVLRFTNGDVAAEWKPAP